MSAPMALPEDGAAPSSIVPRRITDVLFDVAKQARGERLTVGELLDGLKDRAFGIVLLILALPCAVPFLYGIPQAVSLPLLFVSVQILIGRHKLWLPQALKRRGFSVEAFRAMIERAAPYLRWLEVLSRPRLSGLTRGRIERVLGFFLFVFSVSIALPLPLTNTVPGIAVGIMAFGFIERDGLFMLAGVTLGTVWISFLIALAAGAWVLVEEALRWLGV